MVTHTETCTMNQRVLSKETNGQSLLINCHQHTPAPMRREHAASTVAQADPTYANTKTCCVHSKETTARY